MKRLDELYKESFFSRRNRLLWRVPFVCDALVEVFKPSTFIDVGCGIGDFVKGMLDRSVEAYGLEGSVNCLKFLQVPDDRIFILDLRAPVFSRVDNRFSLLSCFEVAEHIEPEFADVFVDNLCGLSSSIVMSFAPPGQEGHGHFNCQEGSYWIEKMEKRNRVLNTDAISRIKRLWEPVKNRREMRSYYNHLLCFEESK